MSHAISRKRAKSESALTLQTVLEGAELALVEVPAAGRCRACGAEGCLEDFPFTCRACGGWDVALTAGEELRVESLDLETKEEIAHGR